MTIDDVKDKIQFSKDYDFIWNGKYRPILVSLGGSWAYGTNNENSDIDVRGIVMDPSESIVGLSNFEQHEIHDKERDIDTVLYGLKKMVKLLIGNNPNCIEIISPQERNIVYIDPVGQELIDNRNLFLSKKAAFTFGAYARAQLARIENAMCRDRLPQAKQEEHIFNSILGTIKHFNERYTAFEDGAIQLKIVDAINSELDKEIVLDVNLHNYPLRDYKSIWSELNNVVKDYNKIGGRNRKKDNYHMNKHAMHLVRLLLMGIDILEKGEVVTYREDDLDLLMSIRHGDYMDKSGLFKQSFYELVDRYTKKLEYAQSTSKLPDKPNFQAIENWLMNVYKRYLI